MSCNSSFQLKICRICFTSCSTNHIPKTRRNGSSFRRFCSAINYKEEVELEHENVTICVKCMPLVESVSDSKCRVEEVEGQVLKLQRKLLSLLNELEEELSGHLKGMEKLERVVEGSSPQPEVFERIDKTEVNNMMEFRKGIAEVAQDLRSFRTKICEKVMAPISPVAEQQGMPFIKLETQYSPPCSPTHGEEGDPDPLWFPETDGDASVPSPSPEEKPLKAPPPSCPNLPIISESDDEPEPPTKRHKGQLEFLFGQKGKKHLVYEDYRYLLNYKNRNSTNWACCERKKRNCRVLLYAEGDEFVFLKGKHNHPQDPGKIEALRIINRIKESGESKLASVKSIIASEGGDTVKAKLLNVKQITRMMQYRNKKPNPKPKAKRTLNPNDFDEDLSGPLEFVKSTQGREQLIFRGHIFALAWTTSAGLKKSWECFKRRNVNCRAYVQTANNEVTRYKNVHNHPADTAEVEAKKLLSKLKEEASSSKSASDIVASNIADVSEEIIAKLPPIKYLARSIKRKQTADGRIMSKKSTELGARRPVKKEKALVIPIEGPLEYVKSNQGKDHLLYNGFRYLPEHQGKVGITWRCAFIKKNKCHAHLRIKDGSIVIYNNEHNHPPESTEEIEKKRLMANLKETCLTSKDKPSDLVSQTELGKMNAETVTRIIQRTRQISRQGRLPLTSENTKDRILRENPEIFLMDEFMQEIVIAMIISDERRQKKLKTMEAVIDPSLGHSFRFDWNEKKIFLGEIEIAVCEKTESVQCVQCGNRAGPAAASVLAPQIYDHIVGEHYDAYNCSICVEKFTNHKEFREHVSNHVDPEEPCDICGKPVTGGAYERHKATHFSEDEKILAKNMKSFTCSVCGKSFANANSVRRHEKTHNKAS